MERNEQAKKEIQNAIRFMLPFMAAAEYWSLHNKNQEFEARKNNPAPFAAEIAARGVSKPFEHKGLFPQDEFFLFNSMFLLAEGMGHFMGEKNAGTKFILRELQQEKWKYELNQINLGIGNLSLLPFQGK